jgi:hypothetical protein
MRKYGHSQIERPLLVVSHTDCNECGREGRGEGQALPTNPTPQNHCGEPLVMVLCEQVWVKE